MGYAMSLSELASDLGTTGADGLRNIANTAANFACEAYSQYAGATANWPDPTGIGAFNNALYSRLCGPRGKNPPGGNDSWSGGQCLVLYNVTIENTDGSGNKSTSVVGNLPGPVNGLQKVTVGSSYKFYIVAPNYSGPPSGLYEVGSVGTTDPNAQKYNRKIVGVVRKDGQPDNCGNYPYPYPVLPFPDTSLLVKNNVTVNVGAGAQITANLTFSPTIINANAFIYPQIKVGVGPFNVNFDLGGVQITPNFNFTSNNQSPPANQLPPGAPTGQPRNTDNDPCSTTITPTDLTPVITRLTTLQTTSDDIKDCSCPVGYQTALLDLGETSGGVIALPSNTVYVQVFQTEAPANAKIQPGGGSYPDGYFWGYYSFGGGTTQGARIPLNTARGEFYPPPDATSFGLNLYTGYKAHIYISRAVPDKAGAQRAGLQFKNPPT